MPHVITDPAELAFLRVMRGLPSDARVEMLRLLRVIADDPPAHKLRAAVLHLARARGIEEVAAMRPLLSPRAVG